MKFVNFAYGWHKPEIIQERYPELVNWLTHKAIDH